MCQDAVMGAFLNVEDSARFGKRRIRGGMVSIGQEIVDPTVEREAEFLAIVDSKVN